MDWQQPDWFRWLRWTLLFAALLALALGTFAHDMPGWLLALAALASLATFVLPLLIGIHFPEDKWRLGTCLGMAIALVVLMVFPATDAAEQTGTGLLIRKDQFFFLLFLGGWISLCLLALVYLGLAIVGIRIGRNRQEQQHWESDGEFRNMDARNRRKDYERR